MLCYGPIPNKEWIDMKDHTIRQLVMAAMFAALTCVATMCIPIPTPVTGGYVNVGDTVVLLSAWLLGGFYGAFAAGMGSALADLLSGYAYYVPGTFLIKGLMALAAYMLFSYLAKKQAPKTVRYLVSAVAAEAIMVAGYFLYASMILGKGLAAASSIGGNLVQGFVCTVLAAACVSVLNVAKIPAGQFLSR